MLRFEDSYLDEDALGRLIRRADVVLLPYDSREQVTSGVLVEAVAAGKPVVATAFPHAVELLSSGAGLVVPHQDGAAIGEALYRVLTEPGLAQRMRGRGGPARAVAAVAGGGRPVPGTGRRTAGRADVCAEADHRHASCSEHRRKHSVRRPRHPHRPPAQSRRTSRHREALRPRRGDPARQLPGQRGHDRGVLALDEAEVVGRRPRRCWPTSATATTTWPASWPDTSTSSRTSCPSTEDLSDDRRTLIGAYFTHEYSAEAAALFNPSMVAHPDQSGLAGGQLRFVMTVRCVGEGHLSSIGFRTGVLGPGATLRGRRARPAPGCGRQPPGDLPARPVPQPAGRSRRRPGERAAAPGRAAETFTADELDEALASVHEHNLHRERVQPRHRAGPSDRVLPATTSSSRPRPTLTSRLLWPTRAGRTQRHGGRPARPVHRRRRQR